MSEQFILPPRQMVTVEEPFDVTDYSITTLIETLQQLQQKHPDVHFDYQYDYTPNGTEKTLVISYKEPESDAMYKQRTEQYVKFFKMKNDPVYQEYLKLKKQVDDMKNQIVQTYKEKNV